MSGYIIASVKESVYYIHCCCQSTMKNSTHTQFGLQQQHLPEDKILKHSKNGNDLNCKMKKREKKVLAKKHGY